ncbi:hypothetical protein [Aquimarina algiphila]|uniref:Uncharacterized protein n=1 Tax=Aquimarina algiphila TaxID=2047982 RepID=A0A554VMN6_9FLAO|nr:hypothetical protein [Aquimarina algiphila]TSE09558.1 hypothetical protein FOF46_08635 [Aquimarina algiphila]
MKNKTGIILHGFIIVAIGAACMTSCKKEEKKEEKIEPETTYSEVQTETTCACESSWFPHSQTSAPAEGKGSPFDVSSTTNCIFHQWSWQKFLWLTKPDGNLPLFLNQDSIIQVSDLMEKIPQQTGANVVLTDTEQAGSNGILKTNPAYNSATNEAITIYYSIHTSPIMLNQAEIFKKQLDDGTLPADNLEVFPVGSLELKVSWVDINAISSDKQSNYFTTVAALSTDGGATFTNTKMALLGMHVTGVVENHPEFIWATFEHNDIAPNYDWSANTASSSTEKLLFSKGTTTGLGGITWDTTNKAPVTAHMAYDLFQYGVPVNASGFLKTSQSEPENFDNIKDINTCVAAKLTDVWNNYFYNGSIWINTDNMTPKEQAEKIVSLGYKIGAATPGSFARGSLNNANVSMETFTQTFQDSISKIAVDNLANCFSCHAGVSFTGNTSPIYLSHIFDAYIKSGQGKTRDEINTLKDDQHIQTLLKAVE